MTIYECLKDLRLSDRMIDLPKSGQVDAMSATIISRHNHDISAPAEEVVYGNLY